MPNSNAFLAVCLDSQTVKALEHVSQAIAANPSAMLGASGEVSFEPVGQTLLHMTFLFFGEQLRTLPAAGLSDLHATIVKEVARESALAAAPLGFCDFELFPPEKANLVVARYQPSLPLARLRSAVLEAAKESHLRLPQSLFALLEGEGAWVPHVTLGKIRASRALIGTLSCSREALRSLAPASPVIPQGLTMLGERPRRVWCDWDEALAFPSLVSSEECSSAPSESQVVLDRKEKEQLTQPTSEMIHEEVTSGNPSCEDQGLATAAVEESQQKVRTEEEAVDRFEEQKMPRGLFVECHILSVSSLKKKGHVLVDVMMVGTDTHMQVISANREVAIGQLAVVALPGARTEDGTVVRRQKIGGEWSEGAIVQVRFGEELSHLVEDSEAVQGGDASDGSGTDEAKSSSNELLPCQILPQVLDTPEDNGVAGVLGKVHHVTGDATVAQYGKGRKIIAHVCNDGGRWGRGFVLAISAKWPQVAKMYRRWHRDGAAAGFGLGSVQLLEVSPTVMVANMIGQNGIRTGSKGPPVRYNAIGAALLAVGKHAAGIGASVHMPQIGIGLAGGRWEKIAPLLEAVVQRYRIDVYVYAYTR